MSYQNIIYETAENVGIITLNRPERSNAMSRKLISEFEEVLDKASGDDDVRVIIITGGSKSFSVGYDIKEGLPDASVFLRHESAVVNLINRLDGFVKPTIAAIAGYALGGGCELAMACDLRIASDTATFGLPEVKLGLLPAGGGTQRLTRFVGMTIAKQLLYTGDSFDAQEAYRIGLINKVVPVESMMEEAKKTARVLAKRSPLALSMIKECVNACRQVDIKSGLQYEQTCAGVLSASQDVAEGFKAFLEKREPIFKGR